AFARMDVEVDAVDRLHALAPLRPRPEARGGAAESLAQRAHPDHRGGRCHGRATSRPRILGTEATSLRVQGCVGVRMRSAVGPVSTILPAWRTAMRSATIEMAPMS